MSIQFLPGDTVRLHVPDDSALDGAEAVLVDREARKKRWRVRLAGGREVLVKHAHLVHPTTSAPPSDVRAGTEDPDHGDGCFVERGDGMVLLSRRLPSGRVLHVDTLDGAMLSGGSGILHKNFNNSDNRVANLAYVTEAEARKALMAFVEA